MSISEQIWNRFEQSLVRRERARLIKAGRIKFNTKPIVMEKNSDGQYQLPSLRAKPQRDATLTRGTNHGTQPTTQVLRVQSQRCN